MITFEMLPSRPLSTKCNQISSPSSSTSPKGCDLTLVFLMILYDDGAYLVPIIHYHRHHNQTSQIMCRWWWMMWSGVLACRSQPTSKDSSEVPFYDYYVLSLLFFLALVSDVSCRRFCWLKIGNNIHSSKTLLWVIFCSFTLASAAQSQAWLLMFSLVMMIATMMMVILAIFYYYYGYFCIPMNRYYDLW